MRKLEPFSFSPVSFKTRIPHHCLPPRLFLPFFKLSALKLLPAAFLEAAAKPLQTQDEGGLSSTTD